jgi:hypothetical protein
MAISWTRYIVSSLALASALASASLVVLPVWIRITLGSMVVPLFVLLIWARRHNFRKTQIAESRSNREGPVESQSLQERLIEVIDLCNRPSVSNSTQRTIFRYLLLHPAESRKRVRESINLSDDPVTRTCYIEFSTLPPDVSISANRRDHPLDEHYLVPIINPFKGRLITGLDVRDSRDVALQTLTYDESIVFMASLARDIFADAFGINADIETWTDDQASCYISTVQLLIAASPTHSDIRRKDYREAARQRLQESIARARLVVTDKTAYSELELLSEQILLNYVVIAKVPAAQRLFVKYSYKFDRKALYQNLRGSKKQNSVARVRRSAPSEPTGLQVAAHKARKCGSYHLTVYAPAGSYVERVILHDGSGEKVHKEKVLDYVVSRPYFRIAGLGSSELHFYARHFQGTKVPLFLNIKVFERPPGALGRAALASFLVWVLIMVAAVGASDGRSTGFEIDLVAVITAALSAAIGTWAFVTGVGSSKDNFKSLTSVGCAISCITLSVAAIALLVTSRISAWTPSRSSAFEFLFVSDWRWSLLGLLGLTLTCVATSAFTLRAFHYRWILARKRWHLDVQDTVSSTSEPRPNDRTSNIAAGRVDKPTREVSYDGTSNKS